MAQVPNSCVNSIPPLMDEFCIFSFFFFFSRYVGKTTTISMLTGLISPDHSSGTGAVVYGHDIMTDMEQIRFSMGVCPQHDVLFENLSVREHILFFAQLKGFSLEQATSEAVSLTDLFHLDSRLDHTGSELSGGQKRKLSVAIAVCGGSKFIVLDEPTAGTG